MIKKRSNLCVLFGFFHEPLFGNGEDNSIVKSSDSRTFPGGPGVKNLPPNADFPGGSADKESICNSRDLGLIPGLGRSPGEGNGNPLQYSYLENSMDRGAWWATDHGFAKVRHNFVTKQQQYILHIPV